MANAQLFLRLQRLNQGVSLTMGNMHSRAPVFTESVSAVSVIRGSPRPEKKIEKLNK
jgi:hypothetical protein